MPHRPRAALSGREPVLVTMKVRAGITNLRGRRAFERVLGSLRRVRVQLGARVTHYSVQRDHVHLMVEAADTSALSRGMQGLAVRIARGVNRAMNRKGAVFADRFDFMLLSLDNVRWVFGSDEGFVKDREGRELKYGLSAFRGKNGRLVRGWSD